VTASASRSAFAARERISERSRSITEPVPDGPVTSGARLLVQIGQALDDKSIDS
jgi:hypothetical protein